MKNFFSLLLVIFFTLSCTDDSQDLANSSNTLSANIDSAGWVATEAFTQRSLNESGPITIVGSGDGYTMEIVLGGITEVGEYEMGTNRTGKIKYGNNTYTTLDVTNPGKIIISSFGNNRISGSFFFDAQWLSAGNKIHVTDGKFEVTYY